MSDQEEIVAICPGGEVYHKTWSYEHWLGDRRRHFPLCGGISFYFIFSLSIVKDSRRLCKRCERMEKSDA